MDFLKIHLLVFWICREIHKLISHYLKYYGSANLAQLSETALFSWDNQLMGSIIVIGKYFNFLLIGAAFLFLLDFLHAPFHRKNFPSLLLVSFHCFLQFHLLYDEESRDMEMLRLFLHCFTGILVRKGFFLKILIYLLIDLHRLPPLILVLK